MAPTATHIQFRYPPQHGQKRGISGARDRIVPIAAVDANRRAALIRQGVKLTTCDKDGKEVKDKKAIAKAEAEAQAARDKAAKKKAADEKAAKITAKEEEKEKKEQEAKDKKEAKEKAKAEADAKAKAGEEKYQAKVSAAKELAARYKSGELKEPPAKEKTGRIAHVMSLFPAEGEEFWTTDGEARLSTLKEWCGYKVTDAERDAAWAMLHPASD